MPPTRSALIKEAARLTVYGDLMSAKDRKASYKRVDVIKRQLGIKRLCDVCSISFVNNKLVVTIK